MLSTKELAVSIGSRGFAACNDASLFGSSTLFFAGAHNRAVQSSCIRSFREYGTCFGLLLVMIYGLLIIRMIA